MLFKTDYYTFELPQRWEGMVGVKKKNNHVDIVLLWEEEPGCSGLLVRLKCLKRRKVKPDEYTELLGQLTDENGENRWLYAEYGREGAVSELNEDLYWRLRDQLWQVLESISPALKQEVCTEELPAAY